MSKIVVSLFISGLLLGSGPCLAACGPVLISYIAATKQGAKQGILAWLLFSLSRICVYLILSVSIFILGEFLVRQKLAHTASYIYLAGGGIIVLIGILTIVKAAVARFGNSGAHRLNCRLFNIQPITLGLIMGMLPCAPLLAVLSYIGLASTTWQLCIFYSLAFGLGTLISPLILLSLGAGLIPRMLFNKPKIYIIFRFICGLIIVLFGLQLILHIIDKPAFF